MRLLLLLLGLTSFISAQESVSEIRRNIKSVNTETEREKSSMQNEAKRHAAFMEKKKKKKVTFETQEKELRQQIDSLKAEIEKLRVARQRALGSVRHFENRKTKY
ncbi:MAG: hypothetical protein LBU89_06410, partial [Fibromonadaceae bacterium]|nr:hypothetical protein [Fibromonadaceae bacterium]